MHTAGEFTAASRTVSLTPFLSQLSKPSAVCFPLTFSSCAQTLSEVLLTEPGLWEWADSQHWLEISSSNWISRRGGSHYPYMEVGNEKNTPTVSQYSLNSTTSSNQTGRYMTLKAVDSALPEGDSTHLNKERNKETDPQCGQLWGVSLWVISIKPPRFSRSQKIMTSTHFRIEKIQKMWEITAIKEHTHC